MYTTPVGIENNRNYAYINKIRKNNDPKNTQKGNVNDNVKNDITFGAGEKVKRGLWMTLCVGAGILIGRYSDDIARFGKAFSKAWNEVGTELTEKADTTIRPQKVEKSLNTLDIKVDFLSKDSAIVDTTPSVALKNPSDSVSFLPTKDSLVMDNPATAKEQQNMDSVLQARMEELAQEA